ncbi:hypothetical protein SDJN02_12338, partial [Cucurbita argyrosperma subsp. argyrosperma]
MSETLTLFPFLWNFQEHFDETRKIVYIIILRINSLDESPKIIKIDTYQIRSKSRRYNYGGDEVAPLQPISRCCHLMDEDYKFPTACPNYQIHSPPPACQ